MQKNHLKSLLVMVLLSGCVTIPDTIKYTVAGKLSAGMIGAHTIKAGTLDLNFCEMVDFLEPQEERECVPIPGTSICDYDQGPGDCEDLKVIPTLERPSVKLEKRAGAIATSTADYALEKNALEQACRDLGKKCSFQEKEKKHHGKIKN